MKLVRINLSSKDILIEPLPQIGKFPLGGRAIIDYLMTEFGTPSCHPLSEKNLFIIAPGFLSGTSAPSSGRLSVGGKSPLTGGIKEANVGGPVGQKLAKLGIGAIMVEGKSKDWVLLKVDQKGIFFEAANDVVGMENYSACEKLRQKYGDTVGIVITGPAGERKYLNSTVAFTDTHGRPCRHAARGGVGAIMGSKLLKAIVVDDTGTSLRKPADKEAFNKAVKATIEALKTGPYGISGDFLKNYGTPGIIDLDNARGSLPTNNFHAGKFEKSKNINGLKMVELNKERGGITGHACMPGCVVRCSNIFHDNEKRYLTSGLEYETIVMLGSNLGIDNLDAIARMDRRCDEIGIDTIETGCAIGILNEIGLFDFGDYEKAESFIEEIAKGTPIGRILGSGVEVTAKIFGIERVPAVKGQAIPGHEPRALKGWGVTYATSPQGADHTAGPVVDDPLSPHGQVERSRRSQIINAAFDATGLCHFTFLYRNPEIVIPMINAFFGLELTIHDLYELGKEMLRQERTFNLKAGIGQASDRLPDFMRAEPLPPNNSVFDVPQEEIEGFFNF